MNRAVVDETGKTYGRLTVLGRAPRGNRKYGAAYWDCLCTCGNRTVSTGWSLRYGCALSCGCFNRDALSARFVDETGKRYGRWLVLEKAGRRKGAVWLCRCDCGTEREVHGKSLRGGVSTSCGCLGAEKLRAAVTLPRGISARNQALRTAKRAARERGYAWRLTDERAFDLFSGSCWYCGSGPSNVSSHPDGNGTFPYNGIDRVDNARGYEDDNVVSCCKHCNIAKRDRAVDEFLGWIAQVHEHSLARKAGGN